MSWHCSLACSRFLSLYFCFRASCKKEVHKRQAYLGSVSLKPLGILEKYLGRYFGVLIGTKWIWDYCSVSIYFREAVEGKA